MITKSKNTYNYDSTKKTKSIYAGDTLVATIETVGGTVTPYYDHTDHLGSVNVVSDSGGLQTELLDYFPYGNQRISSGSYSSQRRSLGQIYDSDTGLNYYNARYMQGSTGRFISEDPAFLNPERQGKDIFTAFLTDPQSQNSYSYAKNNPITMSDAQGKWFGEFLSGQQSWNSFRGEVGDASQNMYDNSGAWKMGMDHPVASGVVVGLLAAPAAQTGVSGAALFGQAIAPGVSTSFAVQHAIAGGLYMYLAGSSLNATTDVLDSFSKVDFTNSSSKSYISPLFKLTKEAGPSFTGETVGAISDAVNLGNSIANGIQNKAQSIFTKTNFSSKKINNK